MFYSIMHTIKYMYKLRYWISVDFFGTVEYPVLIPHVLSTRYVTCIMLYPTRHASRLESIVNPCNNIQRIIVIRSDIASPA